jgi:hypothetical protein
MLRANLTIISRIGDQAVFVALANATAYGKGSANGKG